MLYEETIHLTPVRNIDTYIRLVRMAIGMRRADGELNQEFRLCLPCLFVEALVRQFPAYTHTIIGFCFTDRSECFVVFRPLPIH